MQSSPCQSHHALIHFEESLFDYAPIVNLWSVKKHADMFDISVQAAIKMKLRYAVEAAEIWAEVFEPYYWRWIDIIIKLRDMQKRIKQPMKNAITDEMIEQAREYPITELVEFTRGKAYAWCHDDKNPSLTYMSKTGTAWCAACGKYFDPIKVLMERDCMSFTSAVRYLCK